jgi:hypothetical protein
MKTLKILQMPKYVYFCKKCEGIFEVNHSLQKTCTLCEICETEGQLERKPSSFFLSKKQAKLAGKNQPGALVKETIEDTRQELRVEREKLGNREFKDVK